MDATSATENPRASPPTVSSLDQSDWGVAIFAARETPETLFATIEATVNASVKGKRTVIDVLVNGNPTLAVAAAEHARLLAKPGATRTLLRVWDISLGDKSHAWNQYLYLIWPNSAIAFFIDGYVRLKPDALELLARGVHAAAPRALGGSGVPSTGRSAALSRKAMLAEGGIQGNYCCVTRATLLELRRRSFKFPLGLYRADALLGAVLAFRMDPAQQKWDLQNAVLVEPAATWEIDQRKWWRLADLRATWKRRNRQAQGELENLAIREHLALRRQPPDTLPPTAAHLVLDWAARCPDAAQTACRESRRVTLALEQLRVPRDWSAAEIAPRQLVAAEVVEER